MFEGRFKLTVFDTLVLLVMVFPLLLLTMIEPAVNDKFWLEQNQFELLERSHIGILYVITVQNRKML